MMARSSAVVSVASSNYTGAMFCEREASPLHGPQASLSMETMFNDGFFLREVSVSLRRRHLLEIHPNGVCQQVLDLHALERDLLESVESDQERPGGSRHRGLLGIARDY